MSGTLDAAGLALAATGLCCNLANGLDQLINEIKDASQDAEIMQGTLVDLHTRLDQVRVLLDADIPQSPAERDFRHSIYRTLENIQRDLESLSDKLKISVILEAEGSRRRQAWSVLQRQFQKDDIRNIKERLAGSEELLQSHFLMLSIYISYQTRNEITDFKALLRPILERLLVYATFTEENQRSQVAESRSIRRLQHVTDEHGVSNTLEDKSDRDYHDAFKTWKRESEGMIQTIANTPWHQVSKTSNYVPSVRESRDGVSIIPNVRGLQEANGTSPPSRLGLGLSRVEEITDEPLEDVTEELIDWCKEQGYPVQASNFRYDRICEMAPGALKGTSPIHQAIKTNNTAVLEKMLSRDCNIEVRLEDGSQDLTPFLLACSELNAPAVERLLAKGAKADVTDRTGKTGLHLCQSSKFKGRRVAKLLLEDPTAMALDVNAQDQFGMTATHIAARVGDVGMLEYLLLDQHGKRVADANAQQQDGSTPLMVALKSNIANKIQVIKVLLRYSDLSVKNKNGEDAKKVAPKEVRRYLDNERSRRISESTTIVSGLSVQTAEESCTGCKRHCPQLKDCKLSIADSAFSPDWKLPFMRKYSSDRSSVVMGSSSSIQPAQ